MLMYVINHKLIEHIPPHYNILSLISFPSVFFFLLFSLLCDFPVIYGCTITGNFFA